MSKRILSHDEIKEKLENHRHFLKKDCDGWETMMADFSSCCIRNFNFNNCDLTYAWFYDALIEHCEFTNVKARYINFRQVYLTSATFLSICFYDSNFTDSVIHSSFCNCKFISCDMEYVDFKGSFFSNYEFIDSDLVGAKNVPYIPMVCPDEGSFIGWKKCLTTDQPIPCGMPKHDRPCLVKLRILEDSKRSSGAGRKCRCDKAEVIAIEKLDGTPIQKAYSNYDKSFIYEVGKIVSVDNFDEDRFDECSAGIHFFINKQEAINYR